MGEGDDVLRLSRSGSTRRSATRCSATSRNSPRGDRREQGGDAANFRETSARNVLFFTTILTAFAAVIAIGVVYNNARIALQERAWELASLRVLGFTRGEVSTFLLGELALELAAAIPLGLCARLSACRWAIVA